MVKKISKVEFFNLDKELHKKRFRVYLTQFRANPFYNIQLEMASEGENQSWEILGYGLQIQKSPNSENRKLYKSL